jgi:ABC-2 type transport system permease protein
MEWTKVRSDPGTRWNVAGLLAATIAVSALACWAADPLHCAPRPCTLDTTRISLTGVYLGQIPAVVLAVLIVTAEYDSMMIRTTLTAVPRRIAVLAAKAAVLLATVAVSAAAALTATWATARLVLPARGFTPLHGYASELSLADGPTRRAYAGTVLYFGLIAILGMGMALIVRSTGAAITTTLGLLYGGPVMSLFVTDPVWQERIRQYAPMSAGLSVQTSHRPWVGIGVLAAYAAAAAVIGAILFRRRDA